MNNIIEIVFSVRYGKNCIFFFTIEVWFLFTGVTLHVMGGVEGGGVDGVSGGGGIPEWVAQCYYRYGLMVATHPRKVISLVIISFIVLW